MGCSWSRRCLHLQALRTRRSHDDSRLRIPVDLLVAYSNRSDLRDQLQQVAVILSEDASQDEMPSLGADGVVCNPSRRWSLRDRFSAEDLHAMIDLYRSGATARQVAHAFGIGLTSVKRVLREHGVHRDNRRGHP